MEIYREKVIEKLKSYQNELEKIERIIVLLFYQSLLRKKQSFLMFMIKS